MLIVSSGGLTSGPRPPLPPPRTHCPTWASRSITLLMQDFPGVPVVQNPPSTARGACVLSLVRELRSHMCHRQLENSHVCVCVCVCARARSVTQSCLTLCDPMDYSLPGSSVLGDPADKNTGVGSCFLLQGIFLTQGPNPSVCISCIGRLIL